MNYSQKKDMSNMISNSKIDALIHEQDKMMEDKFKYRNEIEALSRLRDYKVDDLYSTTINSEVDINIRKIYNPDDQVSSQNYSNAYSDANLEHASISWDTYFMNIAVLASLRSKDTTKVGSVLVRNNNKIVGMGYNGLPTGINEDLFPKTRDGDWLNTKYPYTIHSEQNCLLNTTIHDLTDTKMYVTLFPCNVCASLLIQSGIKEIIYLSDKYHDHPEYIASRKLLTSANVKTRKYEGTILLTHGGTY